MCAVDSHQVIVIETEARNGGRSARDRSKIRVERRADERGTKGCRNRGPANDARSTA